METRPKLGVSACLTGAAVRFDGGHQRDPFVSESLARWFELVPVCPEVEVGLPTPRPALRLIRRDDTISLIESRSGRDHTEAMRQYAERRAGELAAADLSGFVLKKDSPSCGLARVRVYRDTGIPERDGRGVFAEALMARLPLLPIEEEGRLRDPVLREAFVVRVFTHRRVRDFFAGPWTVGELVSLHASSKMLLLAWSSEGARRLGRLVARARSLPREQVAREYLELTMQALARAPQRAHHVNVLQHMAGHFKDRAGSDERQELTRVIDEFGQGLLPLQAPLALIRHHIRRFRVAWLDGQTYLAPYPRALLPGGAL